MIGIKGFQKGNKVGRKNKGNKRFDLSLRNILHKNKSYNEIYGEEQTKEIKKKMSISKKGKQNSNWKGGITNEPYPFIFNDELKEKIRKRDKYICQLCKRKQKEFSMKNRNGKIVLLKLSIHHIDFNKNNCNKNNLISLCKKCNSLVNFERIKWTNFFKEKLI